MKNHQNLINKLSSLKQHDERAFQYLHHRVEEIMNGVQDEAESMELKILELHVDELLKEHNPSASSFA